MRKIIIGDIHGCYYTMLNLLDIINLNKNNDKIIFLGDYIDIGYYSYEVLKFLYELENIMGKENCIILMGNHEYIMLYDNKLWDMNGSAYTKNSFYFNSVDDKYFNEWIKNFRYKYEDENILCSHAGFCKEEINDCSDYDLVWNSDNMLGNKTKREKQVFFAQKQMEGIYQTNRGDICLATGCVFDGKLSAAIIDENEKTKFISIKKSYLDKKYGNKLSKIYNQFML